MRSKRSMRRPTLRQSTPWKNLKKNKSKCSLRFNQEKKNNRFLRSRFKSKKRKKLRKKRLKSKRLYLKIKDRMSLFWWIQSRRFHQTWIQNWTSLKLNQMVLNEQSQSRISWLKCKNFRKRIRAWNLKIKAWNLKIKAWSQKFRAWNQRSKVWWVKTRLQTPKSQA